MKPRFDALQAVLLGISRDDLASHERFIKKFGLTMPMLSDLDGRVCEAYGVWRLKVRDGKSFHGIERSTFVIDSAGRLVSIQRQVDPEQHIPEILGHVQQLPRREGLS